MKKQKLTLNKLYQGKYQIMNLQNKQIESHITLEKIGVEYEIYSKNFRMKFRNLVELRYYMEWRNWKASAPIDRENE